MRKIYGLGSLLLFGVQVQAYFLVTLLKGAVVFGFFPAMVGTLRILRKAMEQKDLGGLSLSEAIREFDKKEWVSSNLIGWPALLLCYLFSVNLWISQQYLQVGVFHIFNIVLLAVVGSVLLHALSLMAKYDLPVKQYVIQGFLCGIIGFFDTLAALIGMALAFAVGIVIPPIGFFMGTALILAPYAWFGNSTLARLERVFYSKVKPHED